MPRYTAPNEIFLLLMCRSLSLFLILSFILPSGTVPATLSLASEVYPPRKGSLTWERCKSLVNESFFERIAAMDVAGNRKEIPPEQKLTNIRLLLSRFTDGAKSDDPDPALVKASYHEHSSDFRFSTSLL